jgi:hypothetical protein
MSASEPPVLLTKSAPRAVRPTQWRHKSLASAGPVLIGATDNTGLESARDAALRQAFALVGDSPRRTIIIHTDSPGPLPGSRCPLLRDLCCATRMPFDAAV